MHTIIYTTTYTQTPHLIEAYPDYRAVAKAADPSVDLPEQYFAALKGLGDSNERLQRSMRKGLEMNFCVDHPLALPHIACFPCITSCCCWQRRCTAPKESAAVNTGGIRGQRIQLLDMRLPPHDPSRARIRVWRRLIDVEVALRRQLPKRLIERLKAQAQPSRSLFQSPSCVLAEPPQVKRPLVWREHT